MIGGVDGEHQVVKTSEIVILKTRPDLGRESQTTRMTPFQAGAEVQHGPGTAESLKLGAIRDEHREPDGGGGRRRFGGTGEPVSSGTW